MVSFHPAFKSPQDSCNEVLQTLCDSSLNSLVNESPYSIAVFEEEDRGPSITEANPGLDLPLGLCLADAPDLMGAMTICPHKGSVCHDKIILPNFPFNAGLC